MAKEASQAAATLTVATCTTSSSTEEEEEMPQPEQHQQYPQSSIIKHEQHHQAGDPTSLRQECSSILVSTTATATATADSNTSNIAMKAQDESAALFDAVTSSPSSSSLVLNKDNNNNKASSSTSSPVTKSPTQTTTLVSAVSANAASKRRNHHSATESKSTQQSHLISAELQKKQQSALLQHQEQQQQEPTSSNYSLLSQSYSSSETTLTPLSIPSLVILSNSKGKNKLKNFNNKTKKSSKSILKKNKQASSSADPLMVATSHSHSSEASDNSTIQAAQEICHNMNRSLYQQEQETGEEKPCQDDEVAITEEETKQEDKMALAPAELRMQSFLLSVLEEAAIKQSQQEQTPLKLEDVAVTIESDNAARMPTTASKTWRKQAGWDDLDRPSDHHSSRWEVVTLSTHSRDLQSKSSHSSSSHASENKAPARPQRQSSCSSTDLADFLMMQRTGQSSGQSSLRSLASHSTSSSSSSSTSYSHSSSYSSGSGFQYPPILGDGSNNSSSGNGSFVQVAIAMDNPRSSSQPLSATTPPRTRGCSSLPAMPQRQLSNASIVSQSSWRSSGHSRNSKEKQQEEDVPHVHQIPLSLFAAPSMPQRQESSSTLGSYSTQDSIRSLASKDSSFRSSASVSLKSAGSNGNNGNNAALSNMYCPVIEEHGCEDDHSGDEHEHDHEPDQHDVVGNENGNTHKEIELDLEYKISPTSVTTQKEIVLTPQDFGVANKPTSSSHDKINAPPPLPQRQVSGLLSTANQTSWISNASSTHSTGSAGNNANRRASFARQETRLMPANSSNTGSLATTATSSSQGLFCPAAEYAMTA